MSEEIESLLDSLDSALEDIEDVEAAEDFRESVQEKCDSMRGQYDERGSLTDRQIEALENMLSGARKWDENRRTEERPFGE